MRLPNKITSLSESAIGKGAAILKIVINQDISLVDLFEKTRNNFVSSDEFVDTLMCLFALNKIVFIEERGLIHYVE